MRVLFLLQDLPYPPSTGINSKVYNLILHLSAKGWNCDLLCFADGHAEARQEEFLRRVQNVEILSCIPRPAGIMLSLKKIFFLLTGRPASLGGFYSAEFQGALRRAADSRKYDLVHYDLINMAQYLPYGPRVPSILSSNDAISLSYSRMIAENSGLLRKVYLAIAGWLILNYERRAYPKFDRVHVVSDEDAAHLTKNSPGLAIEVIPIAVNGSYAEPLPAPSAESHAARIVFTGNLDIPGIANGLFSFLERAYAGFKREAGEFEFFVLGPNASVADEKRISFFSAVRYFRWVEDYKKFLLNADIVLLLDKSGTGIKTRVLEAMALGKPVVGTRIAFGGISVESGKHCYICDTPEEAATHLKRLVSDRALRERIGKSARELILAKYSMSVVGPEWEALYSELAAAPRGNARG